MNPQLKDLAIVFALVGAVIFSCGWRCCADMNRWRRPKRKGRRAPARRIVEWVPGWVLNLVFRRMHPTPREVDAWFLKRRGRWG